MNALNITSIKADVATAREEALREARREWTYRCYFSRGTFLCTANAGGQCAPRPEAECPTWNGSKREIVELIALVEEKYPDVTSIYIGGGYDGAASVRAFHDDDYLPWAAAWQVTVWKREEAKAA